MSMRLTGVAVVVASLLAGAFLSPAGPLDPPPGPVAPTYKTLLDVEPRIAINTANTPGDADSVYKILNSGSYYLAGDVTAPLGKSAIEIDHNAAPNVTIDLNGFTLRGSPGSKHGIVSSGFGNADISNGSMSGFGDITLQLDCRTYRIGKITITDCTITDCGDIAIRNQAAATIERCVVWGGNYGFWSGDGSVLVDCLALATSGSGFVASNCTLRNCVGSYNDSFGFELGFSNTLSGCIAEGNKLDGFNGGQGCSIENSTASSNSRRGISLGDDCILRGCVTTQNGDVGVSLGRACTLQDCTSSANASHGFFSQQLTTYVNCRATQAAGSADGFRPGLHAILSGCVASENAGDGVEGAEGASANNCRFDANGGDGFRSSVRASLTECHASFNGGDGFEVSDGGKLHACSANDNVQRGIAANNGCQITASLTRNNKSDGIFVNFSCEVSGNNCNGDGAAAGVHGAIHAIGQANRIDSNNISYADRGIHVESGGNIIVRNTAKGCTVNYSIVAGNTDAQVLTPGSAFLATNPWANFAY